MTLFRKAKEALTQDKATAPRAPIDKRMLFLILALSLIGSIMVFSASYANALTRYGDAFYFIKRQLIWLALGVSVMALLSYLPPARLYRYTPHLFVLTLLLLVAVLIVGQSGGGAQRWIGIGSLTFQPSELAKATLVFILARHYTKNADAVLDDRAERRAFLVGTLFPLGYRERENRREPMLEKLFIPLMI